MRGASRLRGHRIGRFHSHSVCYVSKQTRRSNDSSRPGALSELRDDELAVFQVLFQPVQWPWARSTLRAVGDDDRKPFFSNRPELLAGAKIKIARPLYAVVMRVAAGANEFNRRAEIVRAISHVVASMLEPTRQQLHHSVPMISVRLWNRRRYLELKRRLARKSSRHHAHDTQCHAQKWRCFSLHHARVPRRHGLFQRTVKKGLEPRPLPFTATQYRSARGQ